MPVNLPTAWNVTFYVYIMANARRTTLYIGITNDLERRVTEHRNRLDPDCFTAKYRINRLVWFEAFGNVKDAISREKQFKKWRRAKKEILINDTNPTWDDLAVRKLGMEPPPKDSAFRNDCE